MGVFDNVGDTPGQLSAENLQIVLEFLPSVPAAGQATISWNIPVPDNSSGQVAYSGMVIVVSDEPVGIHNIPRDGLQFLADPTLDPSLFSGERIGNAMVIGSIYEADVKAKGGTFTTSIVVNNCDLTKNYYVCAYICDTQRRYDQQGIRAYSDKLGAKDARGTAASQTVLLGFNPNTFSSGMLPSDGTGLIAGATYQFQVIYDSQYPYGKGGVRNMLITIQGEEAGTYGDLIKLINKQMAIQCGRSTIVSPSTPGAGMYYWDGTQLWLWSGTGLTLVPNVIVDATDPTMVTQGEYWYNPTTGILSRWDFPSLPAPQVLQWIPVTIITDATDPTNPPPGTFWWNGTNAFTRCGNTWCEVPANETFISTTDPSCPAKPVDCAFWYNPSIQTLETFNGVQWVPAFAVTWPQAPNAITVGSYWFDLTSSVLYVRDINLTTWDVQPFISSKTDPALVPTNAVVAGTLWYDPTTEVLSVRNAGNNAWTVVPVLVWPTDPTDIASCSLWFDDSVTSPGTLKLWDVVNSTWDPVTPYFNQTTDPFGTPTIPTGAVWYNPTTHILSVWTGNNWEVVAFINLPTDPTVPAVGTAWHNTTNNTWFIWGTPTAGVWNPITPVVSTSDPTMIPNGTFWFDTTTKVLYEREGGIWVQIPYVTTLPVLKKGQNWYNTTTNRLLQWNGSMWVFIKPCVFCHLDPQGNLIFQTTCTGSSHVVMIPVPNGVPFMASGLVTYGTGAADYINDSNSPYQNYPLGQIGGNFNMGGFDIPTSYVYDGFVTGLDYFGDFSGFGEIDSWVNFEGAGNQRIPYRALPISPTSFLFAALNPLANVLLPYGGQDGASGTPTYNELGVGTTGSPDERRNIYKIVRQALGYPVVTVELTDGQIDQCVQNALETFRQKSSMSVQRAAFFLDIQPFNQHYQLTNKAVGYNKIVDVMAGYRFTSAFLSSAMGAGVYGQVVMQHLYNMGTFDLLSYHLVSSYVEQLEIMFATRLTYVWNANTRKIQFHQSFTRPERILLDVTLEKTEQEIFLDRYSKRWIQQFAQAEAMDILAQIRGKYASLPGAAGNVTLNALDLRSQAKEIRDALQEELDENVVQDVESYGAYGSFVMG